MTHAPRRAATDDGTEPAPHHPHDLQQTEQRGAPDTSTRAFVKLGWPLFIANLAVVGNGTIDTIMAGRLSATDLAAVAVGSSIYVSVYIGLMGVLQALSPIAGHHFGAQRWRAIGDDLQQALWLSLFLTIAGLPIVLATDTWLGFARVNADVASISTTYLHAIAFGLPAALASRAFVALNAAVSRPKITMMINVFALALKVPLNAVFMFGAGPIPAMGGAGAGVATAVLAWITLALSIGVWRLDPFFPALSQRRHSPSAVGESARSAEARRSDRLVRGFRSDVVHVHGGLDCAPGNCVGCRPSSGRQHGRDLVHGSARDRHRDQRARRAVARRRCSARCPCRRSTRISFIDRDRASGRDPGLAAA